MLFDKRRQIAEFLSTKEHPTFLHSIFNTLCVVVDRERDRHGCGLKPTYAIVLCLWEKQFNALLFAWRSWQAVLNFIHKKLKYQNKKFQPDNNILAS